MLTASSNGKMNCLFVVNFCEMYKVVAMVTILLKDVKGKKSFLFKDVELKQMAKWIAYSLLLNVLFVDA